MLVNSKEIIFRAIPANKTLTFDRIEPFIAEAELVAANTIGSELYNELDVYYNSVSPTPNPKFDTVIIRLQDAITYLAFWFGYDIINTTISNTGFHRTEAENKTTLSLYQRQEEALKQTFKHRGYNKLDAALAYLEANKTDFPTWIASSAYINMLRNFINTTEQFDLIYHIYGSRLLFLKIRNFQNITEDLDVLPLIGREFYDELKLQILERTLTPANAKFVALLKKAVAFRSIYNGGAEFLAVISDMGFYKFETDTNVANHDTKKLASGEEFNMIIFRAKNVGEVYLNSCKSFLKANIADYPLYANSNAYDAGGRVAGTDKIVVI